MITIFSVAVIALFISAAFTHWFILKRKCHYQDMANAERCEPILLYGTFWGIRFSPGKVLGLFPVWVNWRKYYPSGKSKYDVSHNEKWIRNKIREIQDSRKNQATE